MDIQYFGNKELLKLPKTAFLASSTIPPDMVLKCYDWAMAKHEGCIVSGFSSKLEQDVLHFLIKSKQPIILVLARQLYKHIPEEFQSIIAENRLLIISVSNTPRQSKATALARNKYICEIADRILFVGVNENSSLYPLKEKYQNISLEHTETL
jgi:predicted Rossmann fold nucleotide-binding protein DprA/Smf involved in DNA uptake